jgi:lipid II:glycine glycyltransferase (peptidoglycan interpeptide bridge formation enzyme)
MSEKILIETVDSPELWEQYLDQWPEANFLQSSAWKTFQEKVGKQVWALRLYESNQQKNKTSLALALVIAETAKRANYLTIAGGPLLDWQSQKRRLIIQQLLTFLETIAKSEKISFLRLRPQALSSPELQNFFSELGFRQSPMHLTADLTLQLDLSQREETLLIQMRKNTRYEVRRAQKMGISTRISSNPADIQAFYEAQVQLANRQKFVPFSYQFLYQQFLAFLKNDQVVLIHSYLKDQLLASAFIIFYRHEAVYHYGVSTLANAKLPGSYACQWAAIKEAKKRGLASYNFWGISPVNETKHRFAGVSLFKRGFAGQEIEYLAAQDYPFSSHYFLVRAFELLRKKIRKL